VSAVSNFINLISNAFSPWWFLSAAIMFEVAGTTLMKLSDGLRNLTPTIAMFGFYACAFACNAIAVRKLDLSVTYAIWSGVGTAATAFIGFVYFKEPLTAMRLAGIVMIVSGVFALRLSVPAKF
jgi:small multidrug resistance pump